MWAYDTMIFPVDKLEKIYEIAEQQRRNAPVELGHWGVVLPVPAIDPTKVHIPNPQSLTLTLELETNHSTSTP